MRPALTRTPRRLLGALAIAAIAGLVSCDSPTSLLSPSGARNATLSTQATLDLEIRTLVKNGFPKGQATAILANWDQVVRTAATMPKVTLKGKLVPHSQGRSALTRTVSMVDARAKFATPPTGETTPHFLARLVLDMSLYVYGGADTPVPAIDPTADVAYKLVEGATTDTIVTPALEAAVIFPAGAVSEPTVVVVTPDSTYYPANCSGPLVTHLCQYPRFYHFNVFPDVKLSTPAHVQVCHVDAGSNRLPLADHERFRIAHDKPLLSSDNAPGSTIVDGVEILALVPMFVTDCHSDGGTTYAPQFSSTGLGALAGRALAFAKRLVTPNTANAIDVGGGGLVEIFSTFGVVDPQGQADVALSTGQYFAPLMTTALQGDVIPTTSWNVANLGSETSGAFTSNLVLATDSLLTNAITTVPLGGGASLVPNATYSYAAQSMPIPPTLNPGTYFLGTRVIPAGADSSATDDVVSFRITVNSSAPAAVQHAGSSAWTGAGNGTLTETVLTDSVSLHYDDTPSGYSEQQWTFATTAVSTGAYNFSWSYGGLHSWFQSHQALEAFADGPSGTTTIQLVPLDYLNTGNGFGYSGTATLPLTQGYNWGVRPSGGHFDSSQILVGTVTIADNVVIP